MNAKSQTTLTSLQCKMARAGLDWSVRDLEVLTGVHRTTISRFENGQTKANNATRDVLRRAFENAGVEFIEDCGLILRSIHLKKGGEDKPDRENDR